MSRRRFDVIIVGGGPAGATAAYSLASAGADVALLDKATFPRDKSCGGGLQARISRHLPLDITPVIRNSMDGICFTYRFGHRFSHRYHEPIVYGTLRREFDGYLVEQAVRQGATLFEGVRAEGFEQNGNGSVQLSTNAGSFSCRALIGADGANGVIRRALNSEQAFFNQAGLSFEISREHVASDRVDEHLMRVDWGTLPSGYAWIFPKGEFLNIGVGGPVAVGKRLRGYLDEFLDREAILNTPRPHREGLDILGHKLPSFTERTTLVDRRVLVIGDAAGLIEPFTGDGISYGVHSARLAADATLRFLEGSCPDLSDYREAVMREIAPELVSARKLMAFFNAFPRMVHQVLKRNEKGWRALCRVLRGEESYADLRRRHLWFVHALWSPIDRFALAYEARRMRSPEASETLFQHAVRIMVGPLLERI